MNQLIKYFCCEYAETIFFFKFNVSIDDQIISSLCVGGQSDKFTWSERTWLTSEELAEYNQHIIQLLNS